MVKLHVLNNRHGPHDGILISSPEDYVGIMGMSPNWLSNPRCSMVLVHLSSFIYIWVIFRATVGKYSVHGAYGNKRHGEYLKMTTLFVFFLIFWPIPKAPRHILSWHTAYACARAWDSHHSHPKLATVQAAINGNMENQNGVMTWIIYIYGPAFGGPSLPPQMVMVPICICKLCVYIYM